MKRSDKVERAFKYAADNDIDRAVDDIAWVLANCAKHGEIPPATLLFQAVACLFAEVPEEANFDDILLMDILSQCPDLESLLLHFCAKRRKVQLRDEASELAKKYFIALRAISYDVWQQYHDNYIQQHPDHIPRRIIEDSDLVAESIMIEQHKKAVLIENIANIEPDQIPTMAEVTMRAVQETHKKYIEEAKKRAAEYGENQNIGIEKDKEIKQPAPQPAPVETQTKD